MNVQERQVRNAAPTRTASNSLLDRGSLFLQRTATVAAAAAAEAEAVDREARFPKAAIDAAREQKLLGMQIPVAFGGFGASIFDLTEICYTLGRACASTRHDLRHASDQGGLPGPARHRQRLSRNADAPRRSRADAAGVLDHRRPERRQYPRPAPPRSSTSGCRDLAACATPP